MRKITPYKDFSWYVKWAASVFIITSICIRAAGISVLADLVLGFVGTALWAYVGYLWHDRALIILNSIAAFMLFVGVLRITVV